MADSDRGGKGVYFAGLVLTLGLKRKLSDKALNFFAELVDDATEEIEHRVSAAKVLVAHYEWARTRADKGSPEKAFVAMMGGPAKAAAWLAQNESRVRALLPKQDDAGQPYTEPAQLEGETPGQGQGPPEE